MIMPHATTVQFMLDAFRRFLMDTCLLKGNERVLLAVSGGVDSMVMADLFHKAGVKHGLAHCNYKLRGIASDQDEQLVRDYALQHNIDIHCVAFPTFDLAKTEKASIQVLARRLRYEWLDSIRSAEGYDFIATAHHINDAAETMLYNLAKGCGIRGLHGIAERTGHIVRPLLFATRAEIHAYAEANNIIWREDESNAGSYYMRNKIRHEVVPVFKAINPQWERTMEANIQRFRDAEALFQYAVEAISRQVCSTNPDGSRVIHLGALEDFPAAATVLYEILRPLGFTPGQVAGILAVKAGHSGALFCSPAYRLLINRGDAHVVREQGGEDKEITIDETVQSVSLAEGNLEIIHCQGKPAVFNADPHIAVLDTAQLSWPLKMRHWHAGDFFFPLGMKGRRKKLQDLFTDEKLSRFEKEKVWVLETAEGKICWVLGLRIDESFRIRPETSEYIVLKFRKNESSL